MQGLIGGVCLLAFLLSKGIAEGLDGSKESKVLQDLDSMKAPGDLKSEISLAVSQSNSKDSEGRSGDISLSDDNSFEEDSLVSNAVAQTNGDGAIAAYPDSLGGSLPRTTVAERAPALPFNPFNEELGPYIPPGPSLTQAEAQAISGNSYDQGLNSYPYTSSYPYSGPNSAQVQAETKSGLYQPALQPPPNLNPYSQGISSAQTQADSGLYQREPVINQYAQGLNYPQLQNHADNELYQPRFNGSPNVSPYNQGLSFPQRQGQGDSESNEPIIEPIAMLPNPVLDSFSAFPSSYSYSPEPSSSSAQFNDNYSGPNQVISIPDPKFSPYQRFLVPYEGSSSPHTQGDGDSVASPHRNDHGLDTAQTRAEYEPYQAIPLPDPNPNSYDSLLVPHRDPSFSQAQTGSGSYQAISSHNPGQNNLMIPNIELNSSQKQTKDGAYQPNLNPKTGFRMKPTQDKFKPYQSISITDSDSSLYEPSVVQVKERNSEKNKVQEESNTYQYQPVSTYDPKSDASMSSASTYNVSKSREHNPILDDIDSSTDGTLKSGWDPYEYNSHPSSGPIPHIYPSGAETPQVYPDFNPNTKGNSYSSGLNLYASDYPSQLPNRPGFNPVMNEAKGLPIVSEKSLPIAFENAKSRTIFPHEYIFPNKMPGGVNAIQCTKENEFHHFWSQGLDCLVCICLNDYGLLSPVCASCGGCHEPPPKLPEPVPQPAVVQPATPWSFEPVPMPKAYPSFPQPIREPHQTFPTPVPYPMYPEPVLSPTHAPILFPESLITLPLQPVQASCSPLPTGKPFTNPLHPCQICICRESIVGKTDVQIECKDNPQCVTPADVTAIPPIPNLPVPTPLPLCEKFPEHVLFPHPTETCKLCKCSKSFSEKGLPEQQITCYPHPNCVPKVETVTEPTTPLLPVSEDPYQVKPYPEQDPVFIKPSEGSYQPMNPVPLPEIVTVEPLPWPPITTIAPVPALPVPPPRAGPLPGPSPHASCQPYPPNQTFQHPWDECQVCLCTEAVAKGMITVEVNCYTNPLCCIEPPDSVKAAFPGNLQLFIGFNMPYPGLSNAVNSPNIQALSSGSQPGAITSTYRPPAGYPSYTPRPSNQAADALNQQQVIPVQTYPRVPTDNSYVDPSSSFVYHSNYPYVNPQYSEYPPRLPVPPTNTITPYKPNHFGYPANYQYAQGNALGINHRQYQPYDPRFQAVANGYPRVYQRSDYQMSPMYPPGQRRDGYVKPQARGVPNAQNLAPKYAEPKGRSKSGNDELDDSDELQ